MTMNDLLVALVPAAAEALLLGLCVSVWVRLRRLRIGGVYQVTLLGIGIDGLSQGWQLWLRLGQPAGVAWLLNMAMCYMMLYILFRLGDLLARMRQSQAERRPIGQPMFAEEGGRAS